MWSQILVWDLFGQVGGFQSNLQTLERFSIQHNTIQFLLSYCAIMKYGKAVSRAALLV